MATNSYTLAEAIKVRVEELNDLMKQLRADETAESIVFGTAGSPPVLLFSVYLTGRAVIAKQS